MELFAIAGLVVVAFLLVFLFRSRGRKPSPRSNNASTVQSKSSNSESTQWRSVEIQPGLMCCASVRKIANQVYLAQEAPSLPLAVCTEKECQCKYKFLNDRRSGEDRRNLLSHLGGIFDHGDDRRAVRGRRAGDLAF